MSSGLFGCSGILIANVSTIATTFPALRLEVACAKASAASLPAAVMALVETFDIEPIRDFSAK